MENRYCNTGSRMCDLVLERQGHNQPRRHTHRTQTLTEMRKNTIHRLMRIPQTDTQDPEGGWPFTHRTACVQTLQEKPPDQSTAPHTCKILLREPCGCGTSHPTRRPRGTGVRPEYHRHTGRDHSCVVRGRQERPTKTYNLKS